MPKALTSDPPECVWVAEISMRSVGMPVALAAAAFTVSCMS